MTDNGNHYHQGPLAIPFRAPSAEAVIAVQDKLRGHATSDDWIPEGLFLELDEIRSEQLRLRDQCLAEVDAHKKQEVRFSDENKRYEEELQQAHRDGHPGSVKDDRTPEGEREAERTRIAKRFWAGYLVLAEVADQLVALVRENEDRWLSELWAQKLEPVVEALREFERKAQEARVEAWGVHLQGQWVKNTARGGPFGYQPAPDLSTQPPPQFSLEMAEGMLRRPWWERQEPVDQNPMVPHMQVQAAQEAHQPAVVLPEEELPDPPAEPDDSLPAGDPTGVVSEIDEGAV